MSGETDWDGSPRVNEDGNLEVMAQDGYGNRYDAVFFKGMLAGCRVERWRTRK